MENRRVAFAVWFVAATAGTLAVWWLSSYLESLTALARTDRDAAVALFRSRVLPAFAGVMLVAVGSGIFLMRHGYRAARNGTQPRSVGMFLAFAGFLVAVVPLMLLGMVLWMLGRG